jgi:hypothetical protein
VVGEILHLSAASIIQTIVGACTNSGFGTVGLTQVHEIKRGCEIVYIHFEAL